MSQRTNYSFALLGLIICFVDAFDSPDKYLCARRRHLRDIAYSLNHRSRATLCNLPYRGSSAAPHLQLALSSAKSALIALLLTQDRDGQLRALNYITDATKVEISQSGTVSINPDRRLVESDFVSSFNRDVEVINQRNLG